MGKGSRTTPNKSSVSVHTNVNTIQYAWNVTFSTNYKNFAYFYKLRQNAVQECDG